MGPGGGVSGAKPLHQPTGTAPGGRSATPDNPSVQQVGAHTATNSDNPRGPAAHAAKPPLPKPANLKKPNTVWSKRSTQPIAGSAKPQPNSGRAIGPQTVPPASTKPPIAKAAPGHVPAKRQEINFELIDEALDALMKASDAEMTVITKHPELKDDIGHAIRKFEVDEGDADLDDDTYANWVLTAVHLGKAVGEEIKKISHPTKPDELTAAEYHLMEHYAQAPKYLAERTQVKVHISRAIDYNRSSWALNQLSDISHYLPLQRAKLGQMKYELMNLQRGKHTPTKEKKIALLEKVITSAEVVVKKKYQPYIDYAASWITNPRPPGDPETAFDRLKDLLKTTRNERLDRVDTQVLLSVIIQSGQQMGLFDEKIDPSLLKTFSEIVTDPKNSTAELANAYNKVIADGLKSIDLA